MCKELTENVYPMIGTSEWDRHVTGEAFRGGIHLLPKVHIVAWYFSGGVFGHKVVQLFPTRSYLSCFPHLHCSTISQDGRYHRRSSEQCQVRRPGTFWSRMCFRRRYSRHRPCNTRGHGNPFGKLNILPSWTVAITVRRQIGRSEKNCL